MSESRRRLLLVDDVPQLRRAYIRVVQTVLARTGVVAEEAEDGCAALEVVKSGLHDSWCIISDVDMPHMTGLSLFAELSAISPPIRAHKDSRELARGFGGDGRGVRGRQVLAQRRQQRPCTMRSVPS